MVSVSSISGKGLTVGTELEGKTILSLGRLEPGSLPFSSSLDLASLGFDHESIKLTSEL